MTRKTFGIAATLGFVLAGGITLNQGIAALTGQSTIGHLMGVPGLSAAGAIDIDAVHGRVTLRDVKLTQGSTHVYARLLTLPLDAVTHQARLLLTADETGSTALAGSGTASASDVTVMAGGDTYMIKKIDLTGTNLTNGDLAALLDAKNTEPLGVRLKKISSTSITITGLTSDLKTADGQVHSEVPRIQLGNVTDGHVGTANAAGFTMTDLDMKEPSIVKAGTIEASGLDLILLEHLISSTRADDSEPLKPLADSLTIHNVSVTNEKNKSALTIVTITEKGLKARPLKEHPSAAPATEDENSSGDDEEKAAHSKASGQIKGQAGTSREADDESASGDDSEKKSRHLKGGPDASQNADGDSASDDDKKKAAEKTAHSEAEAEDILTSYELSSFAIDKAAIATTSKDGPVVASLGSFAIDGYKGREFGSIAVHDFLLETPRVTASIAKLDFANLRMPPLDKAADSESSSDFSFDHVPAISKADLDGLVLDVQTPDEDGTLSTVKFHIAHMGSTSANSGTRLPVDGTFTFDQLTFDVPPSAKSPAAELLAMGYKSLNLSGSVTSKFDPDAGTLSVKDLSVNGTGLGSTALTIDLINVNKGIFSSNPSIAKASALAVLLKHVDLRIENSGLFDKALALRANQDGKTVAEERSTAEDFFAVQLPAAGGGNPALESVGAAVAQFIAAPKNLHVSIVAKDGLGVADAGLLGNPPAILGRLDMHAEANK